LAWFKPVVPVQDFLIDRSPKRRLAGVSAEEPSED